MTATTITPTEKSPSTTLPLRRPALFLAIVAFAIAAPFAYRHGHSYDGVRMKHVAIGLAEHADPLVRQPDDQLGLNTPYSGYGIGTSVVMAPLYRVGEVATGDGVPWMNLAGPLMYAATAAAVVTLVRRRGHSNRFALATGAFVMFATPLLAYAITDFSEPGVALMVALCLLGLDAVDRDGSKLAPLAAGAAAGGAILFRTDSLLVVALPVAVAVVSLARHRIRDLMLFAAGSLPALFIWGWYNDARFGSVFSNGYRDQTFSHPFVSGLYGLTLSPSRGVFVYVPILVVALAMIPVLRGSARVFAVLAAALLVARCLLYARWWSWYGGDVWGPRFMIPALPAFAPVIALAAARWGKERWFKAAAVATALMAAIGLLLTVQPARNGYIAPHIQDGTAKQTMQHVTSPGYVSETDHILFDWGRFPFGQ